MIDAPFGTFFLPGPTEVRPEILRLMMRPMLAHRSREFEALFARVEAGLRDVFLTARPVYVAASSATGMMEAAVRNLPEGRVLALVNGAFGTRFADVARECGRDTDVLQVPLGHTFDVDEVSHRLGAARYTALTVVHSESSTGVLCDVRRIGEVAREHGVLTLVDAVSSVAAAELCTDAWALDFVLAGSQKALALPPGLAFGVASPEFVARARTAAARGVYFDVVRFEKAAERSQAPFTPALPLVYALEAQLSDIGREGIERRWDRHTAMRDMVVEWSVAASDRLDAPLTMLAPEGARSPSISVLSLPPKCSATAVAAAAERRGYVIAAGYGELRDTTVRIGHMGDHNTSTLAGCLGAVEESVAEAMGRLHLRV